MSGYGQQTLHNAHGTVPMRSAPRAARATVGSSKPASRYASGSVPQRVVQTAPATVSFGKLMSQ